MHIAVQGALVGLGLAVFFIVFEYIAVRKAVRERAETRHQKPEFEQTDRNRIRTVFNFSVLIPPAFALGAWLLWG